MKSRLPTECKCYRQASREDNQDWSWWRRREEEQRKIQMAFDSTARATQHSRGWYDSQKNCTRLLVLILFYIALVFHIRYLYFWIFGSRLQSHTMIDWLWASTLSNQTPLQHAADRDPWKTWDAADKERPLSHRQIGINRTGIMRILLAIS